MTNLKPVTEGFNKFCGPAVLSILTGKSTDECAAVISKINGSYTVTGVLLTDLLKASDKLGFDQKQINDSGSLYRTLISLVTRDGMYIVTLAKHFICIEVKDKKIYFCDNHTKEPIPAASSARLGQKVEAIHQVIERERLPEPPKPVLTNTSIDTILYRNVSDRSFTVNIYRGLTYDVEAANKTETIAYFNVKDISELKAVAHSFISKLNVIRTEGL